MCKCVTGLICVITGLFLVIFPTEIHQGDDVLSAFGIFLILFGGVIIASRKSRFSSYLKARKQMKQSTENMV